MASLERIISDRTVAKDLKMSGDLVFSKDEWLARGGIYCGTVGTAARSGYFTVRQCEKMGKSVMLEEFAGCRYFAMLMNGDRRYCLKRGDKYVRPCVPVFYRGKL